MDVEERAALLEVADACRKSVLQVVVAVEVFSMPARGRVAKSASALLLWAGELVRAIERLEVEE